MTATYNGYSVLSLKFNENCTQNYIFVKKHNVRDQSTDTPKDRTLFVQGLPPYCSKENIESLFSHFGKINKVFIHSKPTIKNINNEQADNSIFFNKEDSILGFKVAYIIFTNSSSVDKVLKHHVNKSLLLSSMKDGTTQNVITGMQQWKNEYNESIINKKELQKEIDNYMIKYDEDKIQEKEDENNKMVVDEDGWETVTRKGRNPGIARKESVNKQIMKRERNKRSRKQLLNFYTFQIKESKMNQLQSLRQKMEEDKQKIDILKQTRRFKPF